MIAAAYALVYRRGVARTSLADIAQAADVPVGDVYYYFKTKDDIIAAVVQAHTEHIESTLAEFEKLASRRSFGSSPSGRIRPPSTAAHTGLSLRSWPGALKDPIHSPPF